MILITKKKIIKNSIFKYSNVIGSDKINCSQVDLKSDSWTLSDKKTLDLKNKVEAIGVPLSEWKIRISYGIKAGYNEAFILDKKLRDYFVKNNPAIEAIIKPLLRGRDIGRYNIKFADKYIIISKYRGHNDLQNNFPEISRHLNRFKLELQNRGQVKNGQHHWLELDNNPQDSYLELFDQNKIIWIELSDKNKFTYTENKEFILAGAFMITGEALKYLLSFLNSKLCLFYFNLICNSSGMDTTQWKKFVMDRMPVKRLLDEEQMPFIEIVDKILAITKTSDYLENPAKKEEVKEYEKQVDQMVYKFYVLTPEEIEIVENSCKK